MNLVPKQCSVCGHVFTGNNAVKLAEKCAKQGKPNYGFSVGQVFGDVRIDSLKVGYKHGRHFATYGVTFVSTNRRSTLWEGGLRAIQRAEITDKKKAAKKKHGPLRKKI
jgi:hypothetical protein